MELSSLAPLAQGSLGSLGQMESGEVVCKRSERKAARGEDPCSTLDRSHWPLAFWGGGGGLRGGASELLRPLVEDVRELHIPQRATAGWAGIGSFFCLPCFLAPDAGNLLIFAR